MGEGVMRQRAKGDPDDPQMLASSIADQSAAIDIDAEDASKLTLLGRGPSASTTWLISRREAIALLVAWTFLALVVDPPFVVYFAFIVLVMVALTVRAQQRSDELSNTGTGRVRRSWVAVVIVVVVGGALLQVLRAYEIRPIDVTFNFPVLAADGAQPSVLFYRMYNPRMDYNKDIETIHSHLNRGSSRTERLAIDPAMDVWASDVFRYEFLRHVWRSSAGDDTYRVFCLAESDVVYDEDYIASVLLPTDSPLEGKAKVPASGPLNLAHTQHFWGHRVFEPFNIALLCTSSHASTRTQWWAQLASSLHRKRYRRLLYLDLLYAIVPSRVVLSWDAHHGCTDYYAHCKYIHFTQPKLAAIDNALQAIQAKTK